LKPGYNDQNKGVREDQGRLLIIYPIYSNQFHSSTVFLLRFSNSFYNLDISNPELTQLFKNSIIKKITSRI
jgi:hypothetical protein